jgi:septal ring factor EnvC (AmiA/AmiB activator)
MNGERRHAKASRRTVAQNRARPSHAFARRLCATPLRFCATSLCYVSLAGGGAAEGQQRQSLDLQLRDSQRRLEDIRRERSQVEQELERLRSQVHSVSDELSNLERQKRSTTRIVNELDRQIGGLTRQIDQITVDLLLAEDALLEKKAVAERRIVDIYKRGPLYSHEVLLRAESFGDLLSRYKYLYLVSRQDRLLANDMYKLRNRVARERRELVDARQSLERRRTERADELGRFARLEREQQSNLLEVRRSEQEALRRLTLLERDERSLNDRIAALERARREAEARGAAAAPGAITAADLGGLDWPVQGRVIYEFGTSVGPNNTRIPWHGIGIAAPTGTPVRAVAAGIVSLAGPLGTYLTSVLVDHGGGYYTFYAYLEDATMAAGDRVTAGQVIGHVGGASSDQGPHLHFEIRGQGGIALDPLNWLKKRSR